MLDGQAVGMASGVPTEHDGIVELISMYVAPMGRGRGVGDHLVRAVEQWARQVGARTLRLAVVEATGTPGPSTGETVSVTRVSSATSCPTVCAASTS